jgi:predicted nucleic acid-binding protein
VAVLLDTGAVELLRRRHRQVEVLAIRHFPPLVCRHVFAEFLYGQLLAQASPGALLEAQEYLAEFECLDPDDTTSLIYARIRAELKRQGITLPDPDYWIAAHALQNHLRLVTTDAHFQHIPGLQIHLIQIA